ncbi:hypothetical protein H7T43_09275 [Peribacillus simplex]|uniref:hypothetical protein n=1 Tax=Peribacillus simplex TaxID=1478 RepID=UPI002989B9D5|nr:hypothetical protein [Peribacillus simplex]MBX9955106.1 hypothetical protein [Peribacillus simplex]
MMIKEAMDWAGLGMWISESSKVGAWYSCEVTGRKMRGKEAVALQLKAQEEAMTAYLEHLDKLQEEEARVAEEDAAAREIELEAVGKAIIEGRDQGISNAMDQMMAQQGISIDPEIMTPALYAHVQKLEADGKAYRLKLVTIRCATEACGNRRTIKVQDQFQVKHCVQCAKQAKSAKRAARRKAKNLQEV